MWFGHRLIQAALIQANSRKFSGYVDKDKSGKVIRQRFLDYFINKNNHNFIRSSPVVPFCDPTVAFVNAGMNQFKGVFMGTQEPEHRRVTNSQKCVRVGGKHNDVNAVGTDGYHHTFFEMLGSWSFGDYFKQEACELAWQLLTQEYKIHPSRLYVTYFKGDPDLGIAEDLETKEIWKKIGVPETRLLPFTAKDNFWEMGATGPCGPCTEIHVDHVSSANRAMLVNKGLHDLTELWNIVFIQYNRKNKESIDLLPEKHVDTGMGFERLTAILQGKNSNYDTDNFSYLLRAIHKNCSNLPKYKGRFGETDWNSLDTSYRILADHARMITVCLADGMIPEQNQKLRRILRKSFILCENVFKNEKGLLKELTNYVIEHLGAIYTEMERNVKQIQQIVDYEEEVYKVVRKSAADEWSKLTKTRPELFLLDINENPALVAGYKEIKNSNALSIDDKLAFRLYDSFGLDEDAISKLAGVTGLDFDAVGLRMRLQLAKVKSKEQSVVSGSLIREHLVRANLRKTDRSTLYAYSKDRGRYVFKRLPVRLLGIVENLEVVTEIGPEVYCALVLDKSNLYTEAGGQAGDRATILFDDYVFEVTEAQDCGGYVLHKGFLHSGKDYRLVVGDPGVLYVDHDVRLKTMRNHTAVHLLNSALKAVKGATCQKSSKVTDNYLNLDVGVFSDKFSTGDVSRVERTITNLIRNKLTVTVNELDGHELARLDEVTLIPGEVYPDTGIRLVEIKGDDFLSREPCCGTHVLNTADIKDFCIVSLKSLGRGTASIHGVTGERAKIAKANAVEVIGKIEIFERSVGDNIDKPEQLHKTVGEFKQKLNYNVEDSTILPLVAKQRCIDLLNKISKRIKESERKNLKEFVAIEMGNALESNTMKTKNNRNYLVHYLRSSLVLENVPLQKATKLCENIPVLVISYSDNIVKARCCVPEDLRTESFDAYKWLETTVADVFQCAISAPTGHDARLVCNMNAKRVKLEDWDSLLQESLDRAREFAEKHL